MSLSLVVNGTTFSYPEPRGTNWGANASGWAQAVTSGMLQKAGGAFALTAEVDFGASFGLKSTYFKSRTASSASAGAVRLARTDVVSWRNAADSGDLDLGVDSSNRLTYNGAIVQSALSVSDTATVDLSLAANVLSAIVVAASLSDTHIASGAAIARSKLASGNAFRLVSNDTNGALADVSSIAASRALVSDASGLPTASAATATEVGYLAGVTGAIQTALDARLPLAGGTLTGALTLSGTPTSALHAASKQYVDDTLNGVANRKTAVRVATTANGTLATAFENGDTIDGTVLATGDRILLKNQSTDSQNGIYVVAAFGAPARATDADTWAEIVAASVFVTAGTANGGTSWATNVASGGTIGVTSMTWVQTAGAASYTADGSGIEISGTTFSLELDGATLSKSASGVKIADLGVTNAQISASAAIARSKIAVGTANRLVYNANGTGAMSDLGALTAGRVLKTDSNGLPAVLSALTANRVLVSDASGIPTDSATTSTEISYLSGVTAAVQTQLDAKMPKSGGTFTGGVSGTTLTLSGDISCDDISADAIACASLTVGGDAVATTEQIVYENVTTMTVSFTTASTIDFTSLPAFSYYRVIMEYRLDNQSGTETTYVYFNNDFSSNYNSGNTRVVISSIAQSGTASYFAEFTVSNQSGEYKVVSGTSLHVSQSGSHTVTDAAIAGAWINTTDLISRMTFAVSNTAKFQDGSRIKVIGYNF